MIRCTNPHKFPSHRSGAVAVEMAVVLPFFLMVLWGIIEFGRAMMVSQLASNAARLGARHAILDGATNAVVTSDVKNFLVGAIGGITGDDVTVAISITPAAGNPNPNNQLGSARTMDVCKVTVGIPYNRVGYVSGKFLAGANLRGVCSMRRE